MRDGIETNNFHVPVGEMIVTLDEMSLLLHLPVVGQLCLNEVLDFESAWGVIIDLLGIDRVRANLS